MKNVKMTQKKINGLKTRAKIYNTATALFIEKGFDEVTVDEIVAQTGTSKGAFYNHFKSKNDIIIELFKEVDDYYLQSQSELAKYSSAREKLYAFAKVVGDLDAIKKPRVDLLKISYCTQVKFSNSEEPFLIQKSRPVYTLLREIIEEGQNNGEFTKELSSEYITDMFARCIRAAIFDWCLHDGKFNLPEDIEKFFATIFFSGILIKTNDPGN